MGDVLMNYYTWAQLKEKVERDLDIEGEVFIRPEELVGYANEAIAEAGAELHTLTKDYLLTYEDLTIVSGTQDYDLPGDIYGKKIRKMIFQTNGSIYPVTKMEDSTKFERLALGVQYSTVGQYEYMIINKVAGSPKILLSPTPNESGTIRIWYVRHPNELTGLDSDIVDIQGCFTFLTQYIKVRIYEKEGHPNFSSAVSILEQQRALLRKKFADAEPDGDNKLETDLSYYEDMN